MDDGRGTLAGGGGCQADGKKPQQVSIQFQVHYTTSTDVQFIAVTGDHENLGGWTTYIPLHYCKDGLWSHSVFLPADTVVEWKFVLVENREVTRWEECSNRLLQTGHEDKEHVDNLGVTRPKRSFAIAGMQSHRATYNAPRDAVLPFSSVLLRGMAGSSLITLLSSWRSCFRSLVNAALRTENLGANPPNPTQTLNSCSSSFRSLISFSS
ncbi:hypothetical protein A6R68_02439 [Neotoma lepida]|uniref:Starch-binding domain-containing protein 1 n=1 Tax=Neotoma lepida TaxID=56216 RepID=A0A1A6GS52_NEOLE|nr:hypothetical protein A6R68_02439 [Neotoma lepida]